MDSAAFAHLGTKPWSLTVKRYNRVSPIRKPFTMRVQPGQYPFYAGVTLLAGLLVNRLLLTPLGNLAITQSRSDIIGVVAGATLLLYGVGKAELSDKREVVEIGGEQIFKNVRKKGPGGEEIIWASRAILEAIPSIKSFVFIENGEGQFYCGRFRSKDVEVSLKGEGIIARALATGTRSYLADMKVVPVKETEFSFFPSKCQAVIVQPVTGTSAFILAADVPRPVTGADFGWIQSISNRLQQVLD